MARGGGLGEADAVRDPQRLVDLRRGLHRDGAGFAAEAVEPHTTKSGFLFFDVLSVKQPVQGSHIYLTGLRDAGGNELMYFEIPVSPSNAAAPNGMQ